MDKLQPDSFVRSDLLVEQYPPSAPATTDAELGKLGGGESQQQAGEATETDIDLFLRHPRLFDFAHRKFLSIANPLGYLAASRKVVLSQFKEDDFYPWHRSALLLKRCSGVSPTLARARAVILGSPEVQDALMRWWHFVSGYSPKLPSDIPRASFFYMYNSLYRVISQQRDYMFDATESAMLDFPLSLNPSVVKLPPIYQLLLEIVDNVTVSTQPSEWAKCLLLLLECIESVDVSTWIDVQASSDNHPFLSAKSVSGTMMALQKDPQPSVVDTLSSSLVSDVVPEDDLKVSVLSIALEEMLMFERRPSLLVKEDREAIADASDDLAFHDLGARIIVRKNQFERRVAENAAANGPNRIIKEKFRRERRNRHRRRIGGAGKGYASSDLRKSTRREMSDDEMSDGDDLDSKDDGSDAEEDNESTEDAGNSSHEFDELRALLSGKFRSSWKRTNSRTIEDLEKDRKRLGGLFLGSSSPTSNAAVERSPSKPSESWQKHNEVNSLQQLHFAMLQQKLDTEKQQNSIFAACGATPRTRNRSSTDVSSAAFEGLALGTKPSTIHSILHSSHPDCGDLHSILHIPKPSASMSPQAQRSSATKSPCRSTPFCRSIRTSNIQCRTPSPGPNSSRPPSAAVRFPPLKPFANTPRIRSPIAEFAAPKTARF
eukprot:ANDGO_02554.mRNA.1 hypothetical protein